MRDQMYRNEKLHYGQESKSPHIFEVAGEPAIVINGVPNLTSVSRSHNHFDTMHDSIPSADPGFGEWLEGRKVRKLFRDQYYSGKVAKYDSRRKWYRVVYEDGDSEDLEWHELEELLVPLDISIPLMTLASDKFKSEKFIPELGSNTKEVSEQKD